MSNLPSRGFAARSLGLLLALSLVSAAAGSSASTAASRPRLSDDGIQLLRARSSQLRPGRLKVSQSEALLRRAAPDHISVLVVGCDFSDSLMWGRDLAQFPGWPEQRRDGVRNPLSGSFQFDAHDAVYFDVQMKKVADYFETVSFGRFSMDSDSYPEIINLARPMGYYGDPDSSSVRLVSMAQDVIDAIDDTVDFSLYDTLLLIHAGAGKETDILNDSPAQIFSNYLDRRDFEEAQDAGLLPEPRLATNEGDLEHVIILPESESQDPHPAFNPTGFFGSRGVYCFELGLRLGMLSLADFTPSGRPDSQGIGDFGLMGFGLFTGLGIVPSAPGAFNRWLMGWVDAVEVRTDADLRLGAMGESGAAVSDTLLVRVPLNSREYWLLEYRLQDPDGDLFFSFADSNQNRLPDYFDADSAFGDGSPTSPFDPTTDVWESTLGAEWDWFMSENPARSDDRCMRAGGSGVYIWHVDERVLEDNVLAGTNLINADPAHKGIDVEEADGIQDLDSPLPSEYFLGWDGDAWRGEGGSEFGPRTEPSTATADGLPTGIRISGFSPVVRDSLPRDDNGFCTGFRYRRAMTFSVSFDDPGGVTQQSRRSFDDFAPMADLRLADLGSAPGNPDPDGAEEIVAAADGGRILVLGGDLGDWLDGDGDPGTVGVLAVAKEATAQIVWNGAPAVADLDDDGTLDILLSSANALHAFSSADGTELADGDLDPQTTGPLWVPPGGRLVGPPVVRRSVPLSLLQVYEENGQVALLRIEAGPSLVPMTRSSVIDAAPTSAATLVLGDSGAMLAIPAQGSGGPLFVFIDVDGGSGPSLPLPLDTPPAPLRAFSSDFISSMPSIAWVDADGRGHLRQVRVTLTVPVLTRRTPPLQIPVERIGPPLEGVASALVGAPERKGGKPVLVRAAGDGLFALDAGLRTRDGFPYRPPLGGEVLYADTLLVEPILVDLDGDGRTDILWHDGPGRLHAVDLDGVGLDGWPIAGPSEPAGAPAVGDVDGDGQLELVVAGRFERLRSIDPPDRSFETQVEGELRVYDLSAAVSAYQPWRMGAGGVDNAGAQVLPSLSSEQASGSSFVPDSLHLQPNPVASDRIRVKVGLRRSAQVEVRLFDLEGEQVVEWGPTFVFGGSSFEEDVPISALVPGLYVCQVRAAGESIQGSFAVVR